MTVKDVFELRKQGRIEEAYEAIRPMYAEHKGKYTSLAMFWTAHDILKKRIGEGNIEEAEKICLAMERMMPYVEDSDGRAALALQADKKRLFPSPTPQENHSQLGRWGEQVAADFLKKEGYQILHTDWRSSHRDIDIVAKDGDTLVFVEVKTRTNRVFQEPEKTVDYQKQLSIKKSINHYVKQYHCTEPYRFDIITVVGSIGTSPEINHLKDIHLVQ